MIFVGAKTSFKSHLFLFLIPPVIPTVDGLESPELIFAVLPVCITVVYVLLLNSRTILAVPPSLYANLPLNGIAHHFLSECLIPGQIFLSFPVNQYSIHQTIVSLRRPRADYQYPCQAPTLRRFQPSPAPSSAFLHEM